jgi:hypothetical protein
MPPTRSCCAQGMGELHEGINDVLMEIREIVFEEEESA